ncbi:MAG: DUF1565 domain-containing protein [Coriobacteriia bacterium]|nr:DUF1565 domain-containing protein [Coriobacteriia bacterium]
MARSGLRTHDGLVRLSRLLVVAALMAVMVPVGVPVASAQPLTAETYWVDAINGLNTNPGTEVLPFATITYAASVSDALDTIMVEPGTYNGAINEVFPISLNGQSLKSTGGATVTTIQGNGSQQLLSILAWDDGDSLEGFTIQDGGIPGIAAVGVNLSTPTDALTAPTITGCTFLSNDGGTLGGALNVIVGMNADVTVFQNTFTNNSASSGGAIRATAYGNLYLAENDFFNNTATQGGALNLYTGSGGYVVVEHNLLQGNTAPTGSGGAIYWQGGTSTAHLLRGNTIYNNVAVHGAGMYLYWVTLDVEANECSGNAASAFSGFAYLEHSIVSAKSNYLVQNSSTFGGSVWTVDPSSTLTELNDTVVGNFGSSYATLADAVSTLTVTNCIYWNTDTPVEMAHADNLAYSCSSDARTTLTGAGSTVGLGMVYADPLLNSANLPALLDTSPCIDAGSWFDRAAYDFFGTSIPQDGDGDRVAWADIGCYEAPGVPLPTVYPVYRFYNFTNNTHFFTPSLDEANSVIVNYPKVFRYEGIAYYTNPLNNTQPLYRFYNRASGSHFYTASAEEAAHIIATWPHIFALDGQTYAVNPAPVLYSYAVFRFYNKTNGSHFYTASAEEAYIVNTNWPHIYTDEGPAFWIGQ